MKKIKIKAISAALLVSLSLLFTAAAAAAESFNVVYSGRFEATANNYFTITEDDCVLTKVKYLDGGDARYLNASHAKEVYLSSKCFMAVYSNGVLTNSSGTVQRTVDGPIIMTSDIVVSNNFWGIPSKVWVTYNNLIYMHDI